MKHTEKIFFNVSEKNVFLQKNSDNRLWKNM